MRLNAPTKWLFVVALILALGGVLGKVGVLESLSSYSYWLAFFSYAVLALGNMVKGM